MSGSRYKELKSFYASFDDDERTYRYLTRLYVEKYSSRKVHPGYKEATCLLQLARHRRLMENVSHIQTLFRIIVFIFILCVFFMYTCVFVYVCVVTTSINMDIILMTSTRTVLFLSFPFSHTISHNE